MPAVTAAAMDDLAHHDDFPRLAERRSNRGNQLSGGEQQMLAISRALLLNPHLLIMDEPTEGLAPVIVEQVEQILLSLGEESDIGVLVVEQNIGVATAVAEKVAIMINGRINRLMEAARLEADRELQQRLLGVGQHGQAEPPEEAEAQAPGPQDERRPSKPRGPIRVYNANPILPTRWSQPVPASQIEAAARTHTATPGPASTEVAPAVEIRPIHRGGVAPVIVAGTLDTKGDELRFIRDQIAGAGVRVLLVDLSTSGGPSPADVPPHHVAAYYRGGPNAVFTGDRGAAITAMAEAFEAWIKRHEPVGGIISAGGSGGSSLVAPAMRALPIGVPKVLISSVASGNVAPYVGPSDIMMLYSVTDVAGLNSVSRQVLANGAAAIVGMVRAARRQRRARAPADDAQRRQAGDRADDVRRDDALCRRHCRRAGRRFRVPGVSRHRRRRAIDGEARRFRRARRRHRYYDHGSLRPAARRRIAGHRRPVRRHRAHARALYRLLRCARHGQFRTMETVPERYRGRTLHVHNPTVTLMRTTPEENARIGRWIGERLNRMDGPVRFYLPEGGVFGARFSRPAISDPTRRIRSCFAPGTDRAANQLAPPHPHAGTHQ